jgi:hypothetical protein
MNDRTNSEMSSPRLRQTVTLRLFTVFWWLLVIGSVGGALFDASTIWESLAPHTYTWQQQVEATAGTIKLISSPLPFIAMTIIRRIATGRWRFGPRW